MSKARFCWWCGGKLVGPGGTPGKEPLSFRLVKTADEEREVRVHVVCAPDAEQCTRRLPEREPVNKTATYVIKHAKYREGKS